MNKKLDCLWETKNKDDEWWSSFVTSPLAIVINYVVADIHWLTANHITLLSFVTAIVSSVFIIEGGPNSFLVAAVLIQISHVLDCMDGQLARYRHATSASGAFFDNLTDQIQVTIWFAAAGYAAHLQSQSILPVYLAFVGVAFYSLRGYIKYVTLYTRMSEDSGYSVRLTAEVPSPATAGLGFGFRANLRWFIGEQKKVFAATEGVFVFMLSLALLLDMLTPMLWVFAVSQLYYGLSRGWQRGVEMDANQLGAISK